MLACTSSGLWGWLALCQGLSAPLSAPALSQQQASMVACLLRAAQRQLHSRLHQDAWHQAVSESDSHCCTHHTLAPVAPAPLLALTRSPLQASLPSSCSIMHYSPSLRAELVSPLAWQCPSRCSVSSVASAAAAPQLGAWDSRRVARAPDTHASSSHSQQMGQQVLWQQGAALVHPGPSRDEDATPELAELQARHPVATSAAHLLPQHQAAGTASGPLQPTRAHVLDGKRVAAHWEEELATQVVDVTRRIGRPPGLAVLLVGSRPDSLLYVTRKQEACVRVGMHVQVHTLPETVSQEQLEAAVRQLCADDKVDGVLVQLPLPGHLCEEAVVEQLDPRKDVDGFHPNNMGRMLMRGRAPHLVPCTALGVMHLLERSGVHVKGLSAVVLGDSNIVGTPLAAMLRDKGAAAVTVCHRNSYKDWYEADVRRRLQRAAADACLPRLPGPSSCGCDTTSPTSSSNGSSSSTNTPTSGTSSSSSSSSAVTREAADRACIDEGGVPLPGGGCFQAHHLPAVTRTADVLVVAVGVPELVRGHWVKPGAVVIDVGINVVPCSTAQPGQQQQQQQQPPHHTPQPQHHAGHDHPQCAGPQHSAAHPAHAQQPHSRSHPAASDENMEESVASSSSSSSSSGSGSNDGCPPPRTPLPAPGLGPAAQLPPVGSCQVVGDVHWEEVSQVASYLTPVPGGVGPMTIAAVLHNTLRAAKDSNGLLG